jgi:hypothetical protein
MLFESATATVFFTKTKGKQMPFTGIHDEDMQHRELLEHYGPVYGVPLRGSLPIGGMTQALPTRQDLEMTRKVSERTAAGYEVLLSHYNRRSEELASKTEQHRDAILRWRGLLEVAIENAEDIAAGRATELEAKLLELIEDSKEADPRMMQMCKVCLGDGGSDCPKCGGSGYA